jgi:pimeloyl-ACP methyl ester carboxylesterase
MSSSPVLNSVRRNGTSVAVIFVHGYSGNLAETWGQFPTFLMSEPQLRGWDIFSLGYPTSLIPNLTYLWSAMPSIATLADLMRTHLTDGALRKYRRIAILAHSMGGLVAQRALLDDALILDRTSHLLLFGTPSDGLRKASAFKFWNRQVRDLGCDSTFITDLRNRRPALFGAPKFGFMTIAGDVDDFVPRESSLDPFDKPFQKVVPGNHLAIVKPAAADYLGVRVVVNTITGNAADAGPWSAARVAVERGEFQEAIKQLEPSAAQLDANALVQLALALEEVGRQADAIRLLDQYHGTNTDPVGVLAGRLKRRWAHEHHEADGRRALELYSRGYATAQAASNDQQAFYMAINVAFMELALDPKDPAVRQRSSQWATKALDHARRSPVEKWRCATEGEANLVLGNTELALENYRAAIAMQPSPRELSSMFQQAYHVADVLYPPAADGSDPMAGRLDALFRPTDGATHPPHPG